MGTMKTAPRLLSRHRTVLAALGIMHYATHRQLGAFAYSPRSYTHITEATADLTHWGYIAYDFAKRGSETGRSSRIFNLTPKGRQYCTDVLMIVDLPATTNDHDEMFQEHTRGVVDMMAATYRFARSEPDRVRIARIQSDLVTRMRPIEAGGTKLIPDLWVELAVDGERRSFALEYDRGNEREAQWRTKVRVYHAALGGTLQNHFGVRGCMVPIIVHMADRAKAVKRAQALLAWTEAELRELIGGPGLRTQWGRLFPVLPIDPATADAGGFFRAPWFRVPFSTESTALIAPLPHGV